MKIRFDLFRVSSGKWGYGGEVEVGEARLWKGDLAQAIIKNQNEVQDGVIESGEWFMITDDTEENTKDPQFTDFSKALFKPERLKLYGPGTH